LDKADLAYKLQKDAQETAEKTIRQLEEFINEDAKLVTLYPISIIRINYLHLLLFLI